MTPFQQLVKRIEDTEDLDRLGRPLADFAGQATGPTP